MGLIGSGGSGCGGGSDCSPRQIGDEHSNLRARHMARADGRAGRYERAHLGWATTTTTNTNGISGPHSKFSGNAATRNFASGTISHQENKVASEREIRSNLSV